MTKRFDRRARIRGKVLGYDGDMEFRIMRITAIGLLKKEILPHAKKRKAIDLLLGMNGALTNRELERLSLKLMRKISKK